MQLVALTPTAQIPTNTHLHHARQQPCTLVPDNTSNATLHPLHSTTLPRTCIVPSSAAKADPTRPAMTMEVTTGVSSRASASASTPPTERVSPSLANSLQWPGSVAMGKEVSQHQRASVSASTPPTERARPSWANSCGTQGVWHGRGGLEGACMTPGRLCLQAACHACMQPCTPSHPACTAPTNQAEVPATGGTDGKSMPTNAAPHRQAPLIRRKTAHCTHRMNWMVKTMPTKAEVSMQTPRERGPTMSSCSMVFFQWILPASSGQEQTGVSKVDEWGGSELLTRTLPVCLPASSGEEKTGVSKVDEGGDQSCSIACSSSGSCLRVGGWVGGRCGAGDWLSQVQRGCTVVFPAADASL